MRTPMGRMCGNLDLHGKHTWVYEYPSQSRVFYTVLCSGVIPCKAEHPETDDLLICELYKDHDGPHRVEWA